MDPPPPDLIYGYTGGIYTQTGGGEGDSPAGTLTNISPNHFALAFNKESKAFEGAIMALFADHGAGGEGGLTAEFSAVEIPNQPNSEGNGLSFVGPRETNGSGLLFAGVADETSIAVYHDTTGDPPQLDNPAEINPGSQVSLLGVTGAGEVLCNDCDFLQWGVWTAHVNFKNDDAANTNVMATGWWVTGDVINDVVGALPLDGSAFYAGTAVGQVWNDRGGLQGATYAAIGEMHMDWDFGARTGRFDVTNFDAANIDGGLDFGGNLRAPGVVDGAIVPTNKLNQFSGPLSTTNSPADLSDLTGVVNGSFVGAPPLGSETPGHPKGVIGNWNIGNDRYKAGGIFGGSHSIPQVR